MATVVRVQQDAIDRLADMGLDAELLRRAVLAGAMAADTCTDLDPPGFRGYTQWGVCTRELRAGLAPDWTPRNRQNLPLVVSADGSMCITVGIGDPATGIENATPQTKNPRGKVTLSAIMENAGQLTLFDAMDRIRIAPDAGSTTLTWILLFRRDGDIIRCELSLPSAWDENGRPSAWAERLILEPVGGVDQLPLVDTGNDTEIDVEVERKNVQEG
jgi:hypothetical protein